MFPFARNPDTPISARTTGVPHSPRGLANKITAGALVLALGLGSALPARAGNDDLAKALIAAIVIGAIIHSTNKGKADPPPPAHQPPPRPHQPPVYRPHLPAVCAIEIAGRRDDRRVFSENCLRREGVAQSLPQRCASEAKIWGRWDRIYGAECLRRAGFDIRGRR